MIIQRIQVDGGFLDELDVNLEQGLNVLIGGRGTGKTSVIELIRFCLGVPAHSTDASRKAHEHALAILDDGRVTVTLSDAESKVIVSRSISDDQPQASESFDLPVVFSQTEIESIGLSPAARIQLLDSFRGVDDSWEKHIGRITAQIRSYSAEMRAIAREIEGLTNQIGQLPAIEQELKNLVVQEKEVAKFSKDVAAKQKALQDLGQDVARVGVQSAVYQRSTLSFSQWQAAVEGVIRTRPELEEWPATSGSADKLAPMRATLERVAQLLNEARALLSESLNQLHVEQAASNKVRQSLDDKVRTLRKEIEGLQKGAGDVVRQGNALREKREALKAIEKLRASKGEKLQDLTQKRSSLLDEFEGVHGNRFLERSKIVAELNKELGPQIRVVLHQAAEYTAYVAAIAAGLRGSNLRYNELAPTIAGRISPRELVEAVERGDHQFISETVGIAEDRAARVLGQLKDAELEDILTVIVEDDASFQLLDGSDYKDIENLSVGQRCTVVLPIILEHTDRILIVDQPEDHLDNAFIVGTLIKALRQENRPSQMLFSTHNANIPVLGEAELVMVMQSNGQRGYVGNRGPLGQSDIVEAVTNIMEGGKEAFQIRAKFYAEHS